MDDHPELEFFNGLSGKLEIELTVPPERVGNLLNERATPEAGIATLKLTAEVFNDEAETFRPLTSEELDSVAFRGASIRLRSEEGEAVSHAAPNGQFFTVRQLLAAVEETERQTRAQSEWLGGVDVHHVFFEGVHQGEEADAEDDAWEIWWGS